MSLLILYPGETGELVSLQACLRQLHDEARVAMKRDADARAENSSSPTERIDWPRAKDAAARAAKAVESEAPGAGRLLEEAAALVRLPMQIGEYEPQPLLEGICARFRVLSEERRQKLTARVLRAHRAYLAGLEAGDEDGQMDRLVEVNSARSAFVLEAVAEVHGIETRAGPIREIDDKAMEAIRLSGLLGALYECAVAFQVLDAKKALRFGLPAGLSSSASPVVDARTTDVQSGDAMAAQSGEGGSLPISPGPDSSLTPAPAVT